MSSRVRRASRNGGLLIVANALAYYAGHLVGRGLHALNQFTQRPHHFHPFGD